MSWIKLETHTFDKVEIYSISEELGIDADSVLGKCCRVWAWFDANTTDGVTKSVTKALLDRQCGVIGFCSAMIKAGWMVDDGESLVLPFYDRHNSATAKARALGAKRQSKFKNNAHGNGSGNAAGNDLALPESSHREEKIREEKNREIKPKAPPPSLPDWLPIESWDGYIEMRKRMKKPPTDRAVNILIAKLEGWMRRGLNIAAILDQSTSNNWTDIYEPKQQFNSANKPEKFDPTAYVNRNKVKPDDNIIDIN